MANIQFPYPRKSSVPAPHTTSSSRTTSLRQRRAIRTYGPLLLGLVTAIWLLFYLFSGQSSSSNTFTTTRRPPGTPEVVIVTTLDPSLPPALASSIRENRNHYAALHNYATFFPNTSAYDLMPDMPSSWSTVPAIRHALALHPHTPWVWYLSSTALIMDPTTSLTTRLLDPSTLESLIIPDHPVVPPDSVIHTSPHRIASRVDLIISQDGEGLAGDSLLVRSGDWAKFFLDAWFDPLYRSYNFQKAEGHALEHIVQWHGTVLAKMALVPQKVLNSYMGARMAKGVGEKELFQEGDFVANFHGCLKDERRDCEVEMRPLITRWRELRDQERKG